MSDWATEQAIELAQRYGPLTVAGARPADEDSIKAFARGMGDWHRRAENAILATLREADQRARTEERKAIVARLREPDEAMVEAIDQAYLRTDAIQWKQAACRAIAAALEADHTRIGGGVMADWRVGSHYNIHIYEGEVPVATALTVAYAKQIVRDHNASSHARAEERKAIGTRLREPDEAMVVRVMRAIGSTWPDEELAASTVTRALADALDPSPPPGETT